MLTWGNACRCGAAWLLQNPAVTAPIIGPRTLEQLDGSLRALEITLDAEIQASDEIFLTGAPALRLMPGRAALKDVK